jgi:hypothetical protein
MTRKGRAKNYLVFPIEHWYSRIGNGEVSFTEQDIEDAVHSEDGFIGTIESIRCFLPARQIKR